LTRRFHLAGLLFWAASAELITGAEIAIQNVTSLAIAGL